jgi:hypothetical protein
MKGKSAGMVFLGICLALAVLLVLKVITTLIGGIAFAAALVVLGLLSEGFRRK